MRLNKYIAMSSSLSRRAADAAIQAGRVIVDEHTARQGMDITNASTVTLDGQRLDPYLTHTTIILNKPIGYVCSRNGQGSKTIFELLPPKYQRLQPVGRLDKDSSGLLLLTNDGDFAQQLSHPRYAKTKIYEVTLDKPLEPLHQQMITDFGITLSDGKSTFLVTKLSLRTYQVTMHEGRNRQIRRTFAALGYTVTTLHRTQFGPYSLESISIGNFRITPAES